MTLKSKRFHVYCDDSEFEQLNKKAEMHNLSISRYLVECGLSDNAYLSPHLRKRIDQIKYEAKLLQDHVDLLLSKKSYLEQLLSVGELHNFIFFLTSAAKRLHNIFLDDNNQTHQTHNNPIDNTNQMGKSHIGEVNSSSSQRLSNNDTSKDSNGSNSSSSAFENKRFVDAQINNENANKQNSEINPCEIKIAEIKISINSNHNNITNNAHSCASILITTSQHNVDEDVVVVWAFTSAINYFFFHQYECKPTLSTDINTTYLDDEIVNNHISSEPDVYSSDDSASVEHNLAVATLPINNSNENQISLSDTNLDNPFTETSINESLDSLATENLISRNLINQSLVSQSSTLEMEIETQVETENLDHKILMGEYSESTTATTDSTSSLETETLNQLYIASPIDAHIPITCSSSTSSPSLDNSNQLNIASPINLSSTTTTTIELNQLNVASPISTNEKSNYAHSHSREDTSNYSSSHSNNDDESSSSALDEELDGEFVETQFYVVDDGSIDPNLLVYLPADNQDFEEVGEVPDNTLISDSNTLPLEAPTTNLNTSTQQNLQQNLQQNFSDEPHEEDYDFLTQSEEEFNAEWDRIHKLIQQTDFSSVDLNAPVILPTPIDDIFDNYSLDNSNNSDKKELASDNNIITSNTDNKLSSSSHAYVATPTNKDFP